MGSERKRAHTPEIDCFTQIITKHLYTEGWFAAWIALYRVIVWTVSGQPGQIWLLTGTGRWSSTPLSQAMTSTALAFIRR
jgi:hypothetical protein